MNVVDPSRAGLTVAFFQYDSYEDKSAGRVFLFGKAQTSSSTGTLTSACVVVRDIRRHLFFRPIASASTAEVEAEVKQLLTRRDVKYDKVETVLRPAYCFEAGAGQESSRMMQRYVLASYSFRYATVQQDTIGNTFDAVFGSSSSALERLVLEKSIKGPCWLQLRNVKHIAENDLARHSVCAEEYDCVAGDVSCATRQNDTPCLSIASLCVRTEYRRVVQVMVAYASAVSIDDPKSTRQAPRCFRYSLLPEGMSAGAAAPAASSIDPETVTMTAKTEAELLNAALDRLRTLDPDILCAHDLHDLLRERATRGGVRLGRLRMHMPTRDLPCVGRILCDTRVAAMEWLPRLKSYTLYELARELALKEEDVTVLDEAQLTLQVMHALSVLPLTLQITRICGNHWNRSLQSNPNLHRAEHLLLHAFHERGYLVPERRRKPATGDSYEGGLVLQPKPGLHTTCAVLLDFRSLYPSLIQELNLCFTTNIEEAARAFHARLYRTHEEDKQMRPTGAVLPELMHHLVHQRKQAREALASELETSPRKAQLEIQQKALKLVANSVYGMLGCQRSRFYHGRLAAAIAAAGRQVLRRTVEVTRHRFGYPVVYGDTDSVMVLTRETDTKRATQVADKLLSDLHNELRFDVLRLGIDNVFDRVLLFSQKKKYVAREADTHKLVLKGIDFTHRDAPRLSAEVGQHIVGLLLAQQHHAILELLDTVRAKMNANAYTLEQYVLHKMLSRDLDEETGSQPHVQVARHLAASGSDGAVRAGQVVPYLVCQGVGDIAQRSFHPSTLRRALGDLQLDLTYYFGQHIFKPVARLCQGLEGIRLDAATVRWGVDQRLVSAAHRDAESRDEVQWKLDQSVKSSARHLSLICPDCQAQVCIAGVFREGSGSMQSSAEETKQNRPPVLKASAKPFVSVSQLTFEPKRVVGCKAKRSQEPADGSIHSKRTRVDLSAASQKRISSLTCPTVGCTGLRSATVAVAALAQTLDQLQARNRQASVVCSQNKCRYRSAQPESVCECGMDAVSEYSDARFYGDMVAWAQMFENIHNADGLALDAADTDVFRELDRLAKTRLLQLTEPSLQLLDLDGAL